MHFRMLWHSGDPIRGAGDEFLRDPARSILAGTGTILAMRVLSVSPPTLPTDHSRIPHELLRFNPLADKKNIAGVA